MGLGIDCRGGTTIATYEKCRACGGVGQAFDGSKFLNYRCDACRGKGEYRATIQARKPHTCRHCGQQIDVGTEYVRITTGPWYDESIKAVESTTYHAACWTAATKIPYLIISKGADE